MNTDNILAKKVLHYSGSQFLHLLNKEEKFWVVPNMHLLLSCLRITGESEVQLPESYPRLHQSELLGEESEPGKPHCNSSPGDYCQL